jgi:toxin CcdB
MDPSRNSCVRTMSAMTQFDVFVNPIQNARRAYPFVVSMQSDLTVKGAEQLVAPLAAIDFRKPSAHRVMPTVALRGKDFTVVVPQLNVVRSRDLLEKVGSIAAARAELLAAIDYLFFGV